MQRKNGDYQAARKTYTEIISRIQNEDQPEYQFDAYRGIALTEIAQGNRKAAAQNLDSALQVFERNRQKIWDENSRNRFFDREYEIYDAAIDFAYADNPQQAFEYSERSRAKSLREVLSNTLQLNEAASPLSVIQSLLPHDVILLQYAVLPNQLLVWGISHERFVSVKVPVQAATLETQVGQLFQAVSHRETPIEKYRPLAQTLYRQLIEPLTDFIPSDARLVIVPDKFLNYVPFSALISPKTNKYLVEHHATILAPSAAVFLHCAENAARKRSVQSERLLAIGNPRFDMEAYPNLSNLPNAELEANEIAKLYARHKLLLNTQADEPTVINEMKKADVIHLALHGVTEPLSPLNSFLLLARTDRRAGLDGRIQSHEIGFLKSLPARIVILSACQSGVESYYRGEGMIGFSRSFLSVGVPTVIASFWAVDSSATASLMIKFHQLFKNSNHLPTKALQQAQLSLMKGKQVEFNHPFYWASFSAFGGEIESNNLIKE